MDLWPSETSDDSSSSNISSTPSISHESIVNQTDVLLKIAGHVSLAEAAKDNNLVFSPLLIHVALSVMAAGSEGTTREQLLGFLKTISIDELNKLSSELAHAVLFDGSSSGGPKLAFCNGVWIDQSLEFKYNFKQILDSVYKAASSQVDFINKPKEASEEVNSWVEKNTNGLIKNILSRHAVDSMTRLIFANALYFKGTWQQKFDASTTQSSNFYLLNGNSIEVPMMRSSKKQYVSDDGDFKVLRLPYTQGSHDKRQFSMYIYLPKARDGLPLLVQRMSSEHGFVAQHIPSRKVEVKDFQIPKFKISFELEASSILKQLGVVLPFGDGGLTEMVDDLTVGENLNVSGIFHKGFVEVDEEGTEAAAANVAGFQFMCYTYPVDFVADHPFLFLIREDVNGVVLFAGHVMNPSR